MNIKEFKHIKNRQRPELCYSYEKYDANTQYTIFTMNGGKDYLATISVQRLDGLYYKEAQGSFSSIAECLNMFEEYSE